MDFARAAGGNLQFVMGAHFGAGALGVHRVLIAFDQILVEGVLEKSVRFCLAENALAVRLVFAKK